MKPTLFVNREQELDALKQYYKKDLNQGFMPIYGRRRIGKTSLVKKSFENQKGVYFLSKKTSIKDNIEQFQVQIKNMLKLDYLANFQNFLDIFEYLKQTQKYELIIAIDEFSYLVELDSSIPSQFQYIVDEIIKESKIKLVLLGSSVSMMIRDVLAYKSPLYGRRVGNINLKPLKFEYLKYFFEKENIENLIKIYAIVGGIPFYLDNLKNKTYKQIINTIFNKNSIFYNEVDFLLKEELKDPKNYKLILQTIARGSNKFSEIVNITGIDKTAINYYLENLEELNLIKKEIPHLASSKTKKTNYRITDEFTSFWFKFIDYHKNNIEFSDYSFLDNFENEFQQYLGFTFEKISQKFLIKTKKLLLEKQWGTYLGDNRKNQSYEIDLLYVNKEKKELYAYECKFKNLNEKQAKQILEELKQKLNYLNLDLSNYKINLGIIAKSFKNKNITDINLYDLLDLKKVFNL